jgi:hypothetical protein
MPPIDIWCVDNSAGTFYAAAGEHSVPGKLLISCTVSAASWQCRVLTLSPFNFCPRLHVHERSQRLIACICPHCLPLLQQPRTT